RPGGGQVNDEIVAGARRVDHWASRRAGFCGRSRPHAGTRSKSLVHRTPLPLQSQPESPDGTPKLGPASGRGLGRWWRCSKRGAGITRTALDVSSSERALRLTRLGTLRILTRGDRKAARLDRRITQWLKIDVFFTRLPLLHIVERFPS